MSVGLVFVSHSSDIAHGLVELARQMAPDVTLIAAGGTDDGGIGTSFDRVQAAMISASADDGCVVLCDLGSAILTAETARDFLDAAQQTKVRIADAPLVEGGVAAAVTAQTGAGLDAVVLSARDAVHAFTAKPTNLPPQGDSGGEDEMSRDITLRNSEGLHARPAAEFVRVASTFSSVIRVNGKDAKSLLSILSLGLADGVTFHLTARGDDSLEALDALEGLVNKAFGEAR